MKKTFFFDLIIKGFPKKILTLYFPQGLLTLWPAGQFFEDSNPVRQFHDVSNPAGQFLYVPNMRGSFLTFLLT